MRGEPNRHAVVVVGAEVDGGGVRRVRGSGVHRHGPAGGDVHERVLVDAKLHVFPCARGLERGDFGSVVRHDLCVP